MLQQQEDSPSKGQLCIFLSKRVSRCMPDNGQHAHAGEAELEQTDAMINHMIVSYVSCLCLGWGLLFFDWAWNEVEKHPKAEPWISNAVTIGGASAVLSPIIQWGHAVMYSPSAVCLYALPRFASVHWCACTMHRNSKCSCVAC